MSEYQYYEFRAVDRPLTAAEMGELRAVSTRATITATRFVNEYHWGDFKGDPDEWMERYFDAFLYYANWGTHQLVLRLSAGALDPGVARRYCGGGRADATARGEWTVLDFASEAEDEDFWMEDDEGAWLSALLPLRAELAAGDLRALYLGWLLRVQEEDESDRAPEPPVPAGLATLTGAQEAFREFLRIDADLVAAAAERSTPVAAAPEPAALRRWTAALPAEERAELLARVMEGREGAVRAALLRRFREDTGGEAAAAGEPRSARELRAAAARVREARKRREAEEAARERARRERAEAEARERRLAVLAGREAEAWTEVDALAAQKKAAAYDEAVALLRDLRELAARDGRVAEADVRVAALRERHRTKRSFLERLEKVLR